ncbi:hypothetical protein QR680_019024 [Steinernema hermaphroditum]|uniref:acid phosphatase n=1 Tax=Steinernema hermaphroditum TaxID=289476 RepID=A0AA39HJR1_9BILA|nr:hypothetical protein QR680_019024 [Steinernema hermaphroditum]
MVSLFFILLFINACHGDLLHVITIWRHGDRTPSGTFPNDPNQKDAWPQGWGELTTTGMDQLYRQGLKLKQRYIDDLKFLNASYRSEEAYFRSSDYDRAISSAYSNIAGFYSGSRGTYPSGNGWPKPYSPVPVHTVPKDIDHLLNLFRNCPRQKELIRERTSEPEYVEFLSRYEDYFSTVTSLSGGSPIKDILQLASFLDVLAIERLRNMTLAPWITGKIIRQGEQILEETRDYVFGLDGFGKGEQVELLMLNGGALLKDVVESFENVIRGRHQPKYVGYSTHDGNILALLRVLGARKKITGKKNVDYGVVVALELWGFGGKHFIRLQYSANAETPFKTVTRAVSGCPGSAFCPLETFIKQGKKYLLENPEKVAILKGFWYL